MQIAGRHEHPVHKWQQNLMLIEGWALYCEEMTYKAGLYGEENPSQWLRVLGGIKFRAARIVADVKLHTGQFTYDEAVEFMYNSLGMETDWARQFAAAEVGRYTYTPCVQMSYLMGKREVLRLKEAAMARDGDAFSDRAFHDALLAEAQTGRIMVALDVTTPEPLPPDSPFRKLSNVILTPHVSGAGHYGYYTIGSTTLQALEDFFAKKPVQGAVDFSRYELLA